MENMGNQKQISVSSAFCYDIPLHQQLPLVKQAGFTHISLGVRPEHSGILSLYKRKALCRLLQESGLRVDTVHGQRLDADQGLKVTEATADAAHELAAPVVVVHAGPFHCAADKFEEHRAHLLRHCETAERIAEKCDVRFALENVMPGPATDLTDRLLSELAPARFGFCYDSAHDQIGGPRPFDLLRKWSRRLLAVHLSDRAKEFVDHLIPGEGFIDWPVLCNLLSGAHYNAPILMEVTMQHSRYRLPEEFLAQAYRKGCEIYGAMHKPDPTGPE
jgi:sugar phosphate isomerase/epimerase